MGQPVPFLDVMTQAYRIAGVLKGPGRGLSNSEQTEGLHIANAMFDALKIERCFVYQVVRTLVDTQVAKQDYSVGPDASSDWQIQGDCSRPEHIMRAGFMVPGITGTLQSEIPMEVILDYTQWWAIVTKAVTSSQPRVLYYQASVPQGSAKVWPVPNFVSQIALYTAGTVDEIDDVMQFVEFPKGYREFAEYELAVKVHDRYPMIPMSPGAEVRAANAKARIKANQWTPLFMKADEAAMQSKPSDGRRWYDARTWFS